MRQITHEEFLAELKKQDVSKIEHAAFVCPNCETVQSATSLIKAGAGNDIAQVERYLGFSCVGRFTGAGSARKEPDGQPCNWTLGGLFRIHDLEIVSKYGSRPCFEIATADQAQKLEQSWGNSA